MDNYKIELLTGLASKLKFNDFMNLLEIMNDDSNINNTDGSNDSLNDDIEIKDTDSGKGNNTAVNLKMKKPKPTF